MNASMYNDNNYIGIYKLKFICSRRYSFWEYLSLY